MQASGAVRVFAFCCCRCARAFCCCGSGAFVFAEIRLLEEQGRAIFCLATPRRLSIHIKAPCTHSNKNSRPHTRSKKTKRSTPVATNTKPPQPQKRKAKCTRTRSQKRVNRKQTREGWRRALSCCKRVQSLAACPPAPEHPEQESTQKKSTSPPKPSTLNPKPQTVSNPI